ncbi:MAG TPA: CCA tRNA nucleotidyltransferase [Acidimicrobiia bacterium]|nr:CCA tRNA nucleotidyltransferase [Acidimicrobiia bacterium]
MTAVPERLRPLLAPESPLQDLARRFQAAGYSLHLVGGSVRDALLGVTNPDADYDLTTNARPDAVLELVKGWADHLWLQGQAYGTIGGAKGQMRVEITTFRAEVYRPDSRKPAVTFSDSLETDLSRRDFTVNAMAISLPEPQLVDPYGGVDDLLVHRRLRTPLDPEVSFLDDPLRMMRAARFMAGLGLEPDPALVAAATELAGRLEVVSAERIRDELSKLLVVDDPSPGLWFLVRTGLADEFLPELPGLALEQDPIHHHKDVLAHTIAVVAKTRPELVVRLAALLHDVGKPKTRSFGPEGVSFHLHDVVGARMAEERLRALRFSKETTEAVTQLVLLHLRFHTYKMGWTDKAIRRYVRDAGPLLDDLNHLVRCDCTTRNQAKARALGRRMDDLEARIGELAEREELASIRPPLDGHRVMELLGVRPGRVIGDALAMLLDARIDEGPMTDEEAEARLLDWASARGLPPAGTVGAKSDAG